MQLVSDVVLVAKGTTGMGREKGQGMNSHQKALETPAPKGTASGTATGWARLHRPWLSSPGLGARSL